MTKLFITGIGTDVGKTIVSAIVCEALGADYWKPIQAGEINQGNNGDQQTVQQLISNPQTQFHPNSYALNTAASPHYSAELDGIEIDLDKITTPSTNNKLVIEGAGGLLVPLNNQQTVLDLMTDDHHVIVVSRHYLGSINHTLMTLEILKQRQLKYSVIFNGDENQATESIIESMSNCKVIGRINQEAEISQNTIKKYAQLFLQELSIL